MRKYFKAKKKCYMTNEEIKIVETYLSLSMPEYLVDYEYENIDIFECDEEIFMKSISLLEGKKIIYNDPPWENSKSVIYNNDLEKILKRIIASKEDSSVIEYSTYLLKVLNIIKKYSTI